MRIVFTIVIVVAIYGFLFATNRMGPAEAGRGIVCVSAGIIIVNLIWY